MDTTEKKIYKQPWFWLIIGFTILGVWLILNIDRFISQEFDVENEVQPYTREIGSGTRTAFADVVGLVDENGDDSISQAVTVQNSTNAITQTVSSDPHAISYISLGSLNDSVKVLSVDGVEPTRDNIRDGEYDVVRGFNVVYGQELSETAQDFWDFMFSAQAQELVEEVGFVSVDADAPEYTGSGMSGSIMIVGSTSVEPVMQQFVEAYGEYNPDVTIDITSPGSGAGITTAIDGSADIGMSSRDTSAAEEEQLIETATIALDGIVMVVNNENPMDDIDSMDIKRIFMSDYETNLTWDDLLSQ